MSMPATVFRSNGIVADIYPYTGNPTMDALFFQYSTVDIEQQKMSEASKAYVPAGETFLISLRDGISRSLKVKPDTALLLIYAGVGLIIWKVILK